MIFLRGFFHKPKLPPLWPYPVIFCFLVSLFAGCLYLHALALNKIGELTRAAAKNGIIPQGINLTVFPPRLSIERVAAVWKNGALDLRDVEITPFYSLPALAISGHLQEASFRAQASLSSFFQADITKIQFWLADLPLKKLADLLGNELTILRIRKGMANVEGNLDKGAGWKFPEGRIDIDLKGGAFALDSPFLKQRDFAGVSGKAALALAGRQCQIQECALRSENASLSMRGNVDGWQKPATAQLNLDISIRINPARLEESLVPARLLAKIRKDGFIAAHVNQTLARPRFKLEN